MEGAEFVNGISSARLDLEVYRYADEVGDTFAIRRGAPAGAVVDCDPDGAFPAPLLPPHEVPKAARALYVAAGLEVPDLPDIPDPALVEALAGDLGDAIARKPRGPEFATYGDALAAAACELLAKGWERRTS